MSLLKLLLNFRLSLLTLNLLVILKVILQLEEHQKNTKKTPNISLLENGLLIWHHFISLNG
jgi:hypothetical protein